jgi:hypothetical protein
VSDDKGNRHILAILPDIALLIEGAHAGILEDLDTAQAELYRIREELRQVRRRAEGHVTLLSHVTGYLGDAERGRMTEGQAVALIRGRLLGG